MTVGLALGQSLDEYRLEVAQDIFIFDRLTKNLGWYEFSKQNVNFLEKISKSRSFEETDTHTLLFLDYKRQILVMIYKEIQLQKNSSTVLENLK